MQHIHQCEVRAEFDKPDDYDSYIAMLGNLTLLEKTINSSISNGSYTDKAPGYRQPSFLLTKSLAEKPRVGTNTQPNRAVAQLIQFNEWNSQSMEKRQNMLTKLALKVWDMPEPKTNSEET